MACGDEGIDFDSDSDFDPDEPSTPRTLNNEVSDKQGPPARLRSASCAAAGCGHPDLSGKKLDQSDQRFAIPRERTRTRERTRARARARPFGPDSSFRRTPESRKRDGPGFRILFDGCDSNKQKVPSTSTCTCTFTKDGHGGRKEAVGLTGFRRAPE